MDDETEGLRALAHPLRLRMLSLLTGTALSAAEVARELGTTQANASYHLRHLRAAGLVVVAEEVTVRGGRARRYRHVAAADQPLPGARDGDHVVLAAALATELQRRTALRRPGRTPSPMADAELWVPSEVWRDVCDRVTAAMTDLHAAARPPRASGTVRTSTTVSMFAMTDPTARGSGRHDRHRISSGALAPLRHRDFRWLLGGRFANFLGNAVAPVALAFAVLDLTGSVSDLGLVVGARSGTNVALLLFGGVVADRLPRAVVLRGSALAAAVTQAAVAALVLTDAARSGCSWCSVPSTERWPPWPSRRQRRSRRRRCRRRWCVRRTPCCGWRSTARRSAGRRWAAHSLPPSGRAGVLRWTPRRSPSRGSASR